MTAKTISWIKNNLPVILLLGIIFIFCLTNYKSGTFLSGWDNLHSELNFFVNLKRALFAPWQEYQGLGLLGGMGHASDLFRQIILWFSSIILPINFIRYFFHFLMLLAGAFGIYFLLKDFILEKHGETVKKWGAATGAIFYLLNLGTLQMFYLPLEVFSTHFGFLPWLFWGVFKYLKEPSKKNLLLFVLINILSVSQGYVATIFVVYLMALVLVLIQYVIARSLSPEQSRPSTGLLRPAGGGTRNDIKKVFVIFFLTFCLNAFWLLPNLYFLTTAVETNTGAKINLMSTEKNLLLNKKYGDLGNAALLKGFLFENVELQSNGSVDYIMGDWVKYLQKPYILGIGYLLFCLSILGILAVIKTKNFKALLFLPVFLLGFTFLANDTFGFSFLAKLLYKLPLFSQIFRFPFTKFSILTAFCLSIFYGVFVTEILRVCLRVGLRVSLRTAKGFAYVIAILFISLPIIFLFPVFQGKLFYAKERTKIPQEYFAVFDYFSKQDKNTRIANFPQPTFWSWTMYRWDKQLYSGSGFLWYGIQQPILDRAFDPWSKQNENYYWEITNALYSKNKELFEKVLEKYQINWLLVDENVINPGAPKAVFFDELEEMVGGQKFELAATFGKIKIYKVNLETAVKDFVYLAEDLPQVNGYEWGNIDQAYNDLGDYIANNFQFSNSQPTPITRLTTHNPSSTSGIFYPFRSLFTGRSPEDLDFQIEDEGDSFIFKKNLPKGVADYELVVPPYKGDELVEVDKSDFSKVAYLIPTVEMKEGKIEVIVPKVNGLFSAEINPTQVNEVLQAKNCNQFSNGRVENKDGLWVVSRVVGVGDEEKKVLRLEAEDATNCSAAFWLPDLPNKYGYLISAETRNISGKPLLFWLENLTNRKADLEAYLTQNSKLKTEPKEGSTSYQLQATSYFIQPPMAEDGLGYSLHFDNISIGRQKTINELGRVTVNPIPYQFLTSLKLVNKASGLNDIYHLSGVAGGVKLSDLQGVTASHPEVNHPNPAVYEVNIKSEAADNTYLVLSQAYHNGWKAYEINTKLGNIFPFLFGKEIKEHVKVNNWENGWQLVANNSQQPTVNNQQLDVGSRELEAEKRVIFLIFWPQYLEYAGFVILLSCYIAILLKKTM